MAEQSHNAPRMLRTMTFVPAYDEDLIIEALDAGADSLVLTLEDLTPAEHKDRARTIFRDVAAEVTRRGAVVMARPNAIDSGRLEGDLEAVLGPDLHCLNIPKAESARDVQVYCDLLDRMEPEHGLEPGWTVLRPVTETALAIRYAFEIASASSRVAYMGGVSGGFYGDLGRTVGLTLTDDGRESFFFRAKVLLDVRAAGMPFPIGGARTINRDLSSMRRLAEENKALGYTGSYCSYTWAPELIAMCNEVFTPTPAEVEEWSGWTGHHRHAGVVAKLDLAKRLGVAGA